jgi:Na+/phosphate symporter
MGFTDSLSLGIETIIGILIFAAFFAGLAPTVIEIIQNAGSAIALSSTTILIFSLLVIAFVAGAFLKLFKKLTEPDRPEIQYGG